MKSVWKYPLFRDENELQVPKGAQLLHVAAQLDWPCLWFLVDSDSDQQIRHENSIVRGYGLLGENAEMRRYSVRETGRDCSGLGAYVGTCHCRGGHYVLHVFETEAS